MSWAYRDDGDSYGFPAAPIAIGLACVLLVGAVVYAVHRAHRHEAVPAGVVHVPAGTGTLPATDRPPPAQVISGLAYGPDPVQRLDLYRPPGARGRLPLLVYLHSGGWLSGGRDEVPDFLLQQVAHLGVELASVGYRLSAPHGQNPFPAAPNDVDRAVRWLTSNSAYLALDPNRIVLTGTSAGGHLAALEALAPSTEPGLPSALAGATPHVIGVVDVVGPSDLLAMGREGGIAAGMVTTFLDCPRQAVGSCDPATLRAASIAPHLTRSAPPAFLVYGSRDTLVPASAQGTPLARAWASARGDATRAPGDRGVWYEVADDGHNVTQASIDMAALAQWLSAVLSGRLH